MRSPRPNAKSQGRKPKKHRKRSRKGSSNPYAVHVPADYGWLVLGSLVKDLRQELPATFYRTMCDLIRARDQRSLNDYINKTASLQVFSRNAETVPIDTVRAMRMCDLLKKFCVPNPDEELSRANATLEKFEKAQRRCEVMNNKDPEWDGRTPPRTELLFSAPNADLFEIPVFEIAKAFVKRVLGDFDYEAILNGQKHGQGTALNSGRGRTSCFDKVQPPIGVTSRSEAHVFYSILTDDRWLRSLIARYTNKPLEASLPNKLYGRERFDEARCTRPGSKGWPSRTLLNSWSPAEWRDFWKWVLRVEEANELLSVPKTSEINRFIAREPSGDMWMQLGIASYITKRLRLFGIELDNQEKNRQLAVLYSYNGAGATIDLSDASQSISRAFVHWMLPNDWYHLLDDLSCDVGIVKGADGSEVLRFNYQEQASTGNGFTFPLETLLFTALVYAVIKQQGGCWEDELPGTAVYGDDIIVPQRYAHELIFILTRAGFKVNITKTFVRGDVRESCGVDAYQGQDIRPVSLWSMPESVIDVFITFNLISRKFLAYFGREPLEVRQTLLKWIPHHLQFFGPYAQSETAWLFQRLPNWDARFYNLRYQRMEWVIPALGMSRKELPVPREQKQAFGVLLHDLRNLPPTEFADKWTEKRRNNKDATRFVILGRNCPKVIKTRVARLTTWPDPLRCTDSVCRV